MGFQVIFTSRSEFNITVTERVNTCQTLFGILHDLFPFLTVSRGYMYYSSLNTKKIKIKIIR